MTATDIAAIRDALRSVAFAYVCACVHHDKKDRHDIGDPCPVEARIADAYRRMDALELAQKDAARLNWLTRNRLKEIPPGRDGPAYGLVQFQWGQWREQPGPATAEGFRAAIDAAIAASPPQSPAADQSAP